MLFESAQNAGAEPACSYFFEHPVQWIEIRRLEEIPEAFAAIEQAVADGFWVAGYLGYECGYHWEPSAAADFEAPEGLPLAAFGVYRAPVSPVPSAAEESACGLTDVALSLSPERFTEQFKRIQQWIAEGDTYQVNLTCRVEAAYSQGAEVLFAHMMQRQPVEFGAMLNVAGRVVLSASPELFFQRKGRELRVRPMKGTSRRGLDAAEDDRLAAALALDEKNRAENVMIVDLLRSDIGRIAEMGSVRVEDLFKVERHPSLLQMTSTVVGELREEMSFYELFRALFPCGSIVGAPKVRTMQIIRELEGRDRGVYTGAIGYIRPGGDAVFSVGIRTAVLEQGRLSMGVGAGVTAGSDADAEFEECLLKAEFLRDRSFELIESLRWEAGECALLELHLRRMERSAKFFGFSFERQSAQRAIAECADGLTTDRAWKLRMTMNAAGVCRVSAMPLEEETSAVLHARLWPEPMRASDAWLQHKTTRRAHYEWALRVAQKVGCVDAVFLNEHGMVTEGSIHNVLVRHGSLWRTPPLSAGILPGVYREHLLATQSEVLEQDIHVDELWGADEIYLMNAVRGLRRVELQREWLAAAPRIAGA
ncbi:aminodeoxychorismate synthase component I [Granulicella sp. 5B5]|uniref:aminodeoxychorismate synthase component I n=1 Tax=Granulicella sp. 5B5 TaxID=1617967 RepID=UPI0015F6D8E7|nr:aminodeoxychorismate synthase component I [Granulicella sp. 5B5]